MAIKLHSLHSCCDQGPCAELARGKFVEQFGGKLRVQVPHVLHELSLKRLLYIHERGIRKYLYSHYQVESVQRANIINDKLVKVNALDDA